VAELNKYRNPVSGRIHREFTFCLRCEYKERTESWVKEKWHCPKCTADALNAFPAEMMMFVIGFLL